MSFLIAIAALVGLVWGVVFLRRTPLLIGCALFVVVGYVLGHEFLHFRMGPLPLTLDRLFLLALLVSFAWHWRCGRLQKPRLTGADWLLFLMVGLFTASTLWHGPPSLPIEGTSPLWRLIASYLMPLTLYWIARQAPVDARILQVVMGVLAVLGFFLAITAIAEVTGQWWAVFPRYIADPLRGTHFGRARGPTLMAASMGIYLTLGLLASWMLLAWRSRATQLLLALLVPLYAVAVYFTYTRSTWLGLATAAMILLMLRLQGAWRNLVVGAALVAGLLVLGAKWDSIVALQRETSAHETRHSVAQRQSFLYVSWQMFLDRPVLGCGFGRFFDRKLPYLADRSQPFELASIRELEHHNTFLSVLTETGLAGLIPFLFLLAAWAVTAWRLAQSRTSPDWVRRYGVFLLALLATYVTSAAFHDLSLSPSEHWILFLFAGLGTGLLAREGLLQPASLGRFAQYLQRGGASPVCSRSTSTTR